MGGANVYILWNPPFFSSILSGMVPWHWQQHFKVLVLHLGLDLLEFMLRINKIKKQFLLLQEAMAFFRSQLPVALQALQQLQQQVGMEVSTNL